MSIELVNGAVLLPDAPNWKAEVELCLHWHTEIATALDGTEDRAGLRDTPAATLHWTISSKGVSQCAAATNRIRRAVAGGSAAAPCHSRASECFGGTKSALTLAPTPWPWAAGDWLLVNGQARQVAAVSGGNTLTLAGELETLPSVGSPVYPLIFGRLEVEPARQQAPDAFTMRCRLHVDAWRIGEAGLPRVYGGSPIAPDLFTAAWTRQNLTGVSDRRIEFTALLAGEMELTVAESFLSGVGARRDAFWLPSPELAMIVQAGAEGGCLIAAQGLAEELAEGRDLHIWFVHPTLPPMAAQITSVTEGPVTGMERVTLAGALPHALDAGWDAFRLRLGRLEKDDVREIAAANGVTLLRIAAVPLPDGAGAGRRPVFLYRFESRQDPASVLRLTNHASTVNFDGEAYTPARLSHHGSADGELILRSGCETGNPLTLDQEFNVTIRRTDPAAIVFAGRTGRTRLDGRGAETVLRWPADLRERALPAFRVGASCNHRLYGPACGLASADWSFNDALSSQSGAEITLALDPGHPDNWFAGGHLIAGAERRTIVASAGVTLLLGEPLREAAVGDAVTALAGCTHFAAQCAEKFSNLPRFGGHPFVAEGQPSRPLPQFAGWQRLDVADFAAADNWTHDDDGHRADLTRGVCLGPVDALTHCWIDGSLVWTGNEERGDTESVNVTIPGRGEATLFWGKTNQASQPDLAALGHPAYAGQCYLRLSQFLIGPDAARLPRIEVALQRHPNVPWLADIAVSLNADANPVVFLAELLMHPTRGAALDASLFDQPQWLASAQRIADEDGGCSPLIDHEMSLGQITDAICAYVDGRLHWTLEGKLQLLLRRETPADVSGLPILGASALIAPPQLDPADASTVPNRTVVTCVERERGWTPDSGQWLDDGAFAIAGEERAQTLNRPWITRRAAAAVLARRAGKSATQRRVKGTLRARLSKALTLAPGDWLRLEDDLRALQCVARRITEGASPVVELEVEGGGPLEDARERFDTADAIHHDPPLPES